MDDKLLRLRVDKQAFAELPVPLEEALAAFSRLDEAYRATLAHADEYDEDDAFESILFGLEAEWGLQDDDLDMKAAQALDVYLRARDALDSAARH